MTQMILKSLTTSTIEILKCSLVPHFPRPTTHSTSMSTLHVHVQSYLVSLLTDSQNIVRRSLVENGLAQLCVFFGRQKANDVVLSHLITFLNDKNDWQLRAAFYSGIAGVNAFVGSQAASMLKPLLLQGLGDSEDAVISTAIKALTDMTGAGECGESSVAPCTFFYRRHGTVTRHVRSRPLLVIFFLLYRPRSKTVDSRADGGSCPFPVPSKHLVRIANMCYNRYQVS